MTQPRRGTFRAKDLRQVVPAGAFTDLREPALRIGDVVRLNSGGPLMLVVDNFLLDRTSDELLLLGAFITVAYRSRDRDKPVIREWDLPKVCVHRVRDAW